MLHCARHFCALIVLSLATFVSPVFAQFSQVGPKLVGIGSVGSASQGRASAMSADGNTVIVGGHADNGFAGAAWVWTKSGGVWSQQGAKLVGSGAVGAAMQGASVALSADGNTAIVGGLDDDGSTGAVWVWTRNAGVWSQQGSKLVASGTGPYSTQGLSVALSADGNTAIVGGRHASSGAAWVWTRSAGIWSQQGSELVGTGAVGNASQGVSVALSADGHTAIVGGSSDSVYAGAAWIWTRNAGVWSQQGGKLVGSGAVGVARQGTSVAISGDGNTAIVGGPSDDSYAGAAWVWSRNAGVWSQQGNKLVGSGAVVGFPQKRGVSVALSFDGSKALVGATGENYVTGATWVWTRNAGVWGQQGNKLVGSGAVGNAAQGGSVSLSADGTLALIGGALDNNDSGAVWVWAIATAPSVTSVSPASGAINGGTAVTITGSGFANGAMVTVGGVPATAVTWVSSTSLTVSTPAGTLGTKDVVVTNPDTQAAALTNGFTYVAAPICGSNGIPCLVPPPMMAGISNLPMVQDLSSGNGPAMTSCLMGALRQSLGGAPVFLGQTATGEANVSWNGQLISFYPVDAGTTTNSNAGLQPGSSNPLNIATSCGTLVVTPAVFNAKEMGSVLNSMGVWADIQQQGVITVFLNGTWYVVRPEFLVTPGVPGLPRFETRSDGLLRFIDSAGNSQILRPAFLDPQALQNLLTPMGGAISIQLDGSAQLNMGGQHFTLTPDMTLGGFVSEHAAENWWKESASRYRFRNAVAAFIATTQGFTLAPAP